MEQKISIGSVLKPQGIRGEVKVKVFLDSAEELKSFKRVLIGGGGAAFLQHSGAPRPAPLSEGVLFFEKKKDIMTHTRVNALSWRC